MDMNTHNPLIVCDIFIHSIIFHTLTNASQTLRGQQPLTADTISSSSLPSYHIGLQFTGTSTPIPSILVPLTDQLTLPQKVAISLGQSETCIVEKGKSLCVHFPFSGAVSSMSTTDSSSNISPPVPPQLSLVLLSSKDTSNQGGAEFVGNGTVSLQTMVQRLTTPSPFPTAHSTASPLDHVDIANDQPSTNPSVSPSPTVLEQFRIPIYDLVTQKIASVLISVRLGCVPSHLHAYFLQQLIAQSATSNPVHGYGTTNDNSNASVTRSNPSSSTVSSTSFHLPVRTNHHPLVSNDKQDENFQRTMLKTMERGKKELTSTNVYIPPPIWYGNIGPITVPVIPPQPPSATTEPTSSLAGGEPSTATATQDKTSQPTAAPTAATVHSLPLGFREETNETNTTKPVLHNDNEKLSNILTGDSDTEVLDQLLAELIRWRDVVRSSDTEQQQYQAVTLTSPKKGSHTNNSTKMNPLTINNPLKDGISSSMAALQKALLSSGISESIANRLVQTLGRNHIHPLESSSKANLPVGIQDFVKRGVTFNSSTDLHSHPLFGGEERTRILAAAFPRTFRVLRGSDTPEEMQQAIDTIYSLQEQRKSSLRSNVYKNGILMNDPLSSSSYGSVPASPLAGSPLRPQQLISPKTTTGKVQSPTGILRNRTGGTTNLNSSFGSNNGIPLPSTLSNSPYAKAILPPRRTTTSHPRPSGTTPLPSANTNESFYSTGTERRDSIGNRSHTSSNNNNENEPVRGVRLTTAMRARLAALEEEKRFERLQASRDASILSAAEANGPVWVERERRRRSSHDRHSVSTFRTTDERTADNEDKLNSTFHSATSGGEYVSQTNKDARRSAGYRAPVEPNEIRSLRTSPHKHALELMPSARVKVNHNSTVPGNPQADRTSATTVTATIVPSVLRESVELPNTSVLVTSNPGQASLLRNLTNNNSNASTINRTVNGETFNITAYEDKSSSSSRNDTILPSAEKFAPVTNNEESILQLSVSGSPSKLQSVLSPSQFVIENGSNDHTVGSNGGVPLYQTVDASIISSVPSAPSSSTSGGGDNSQNITRKSDDSVHTPDLNATGMSGTHLSALGLGLGATGKKGSRPEHEEGGDDEFSEPSGDGERNGKNLLTSPLSDSSESIAHRNRHSTFRSTDKYTNERVKAAMERIAAATSSDSFGSLSSVSDSNDLSSVLSPPSGVKSTTNRSARFALSGSSDDILIETSDESSNDYSGSKRYHPSHQQRRVDFEDDEEDDQEEEEEEEEDTDF